MAEPTTQQEFQFKELDKFTMFTNAPGVEGKRSRLQWSTFRGNPRITVFTSVPNDSGKGVINAAMNPETFLIFLDMLENIAKETNEVKYKLDCDTLLKTSDGQRATERTLNSSIWFGRDANGLIWISVAAEGRPKIKFDFKISDFHRIYKGDGTALNEREASSLQTQAVIRALRSILIPHMGELRPPYVPGMTNGRPNKQPQGTAVSTATFDDISF